MIERICLIGIVLSIALMGVCFVMIQKDYDASVARIAVMEKRMNHWLPTDQPKGK
jgi:hypothetical protein